MTKKILIPWFAITGTASYPDDSTKFSRMESVEFNGNSYFLCEYTGVKNLESGPADYAKYSAWLATQPAVTGIKGISTAGFYLRFTPAERRALREIVSNPDHDNPYHEGIVDFYELFLHLLDYVDVEDPMLSSALDAMVVVGILLEGRQAELLVDANGVEVVTTGAELEEKSKPKSKSKPK